MPLPRRPLADDHSSVTARILLIGATLGAAMSAAACDSLLTKPSLYNQVQVIVVDTDSEPVPNARVELYTGDRPIYYANTGADGRYLFRRVPQNVYGVRFHPIPTDYDTIGGVIGARRADVRDGLDVRGETTVVVNFTLRKLTNR